MHEMRAAAHRKAALYDEAAAARYALAGRTEERVAALFAAMRGWGWELLADRRWPVARAANIDMIAVGPGGVLVVDVKAWAEPSVRDGRLYRGDADADDEVDTLLRMTETVEDAVATLGLVTSGVVPVIVLAGRGDDAVCVGRVRVVGERQLAIWAARQPARIPPDRVEQLTQVLAAELPPYDDPVPVHVPLPLVDPVPPRLPPAGEQQELVDVDALTDALLDAATAGTVEDWMSFLHPAQLALVRRNWNGAARIRGPAGTGKTVVALHRIAYLAATRPGPILVTTYVKTLPIVLAGVYRRLSPETADRVEFAGLHQLASGLLARRNLPSRVLAGQVDRVWQEAWRTNGARTCLPGLVADQRYWRGEIDSVIKGRGIREFPEYAGLDRPGRRTRLREEHRAAVWDLYEAYQRQLIDRRLMDFNDLLAAAYRETARCPVAPPYQAVVVDEVNDLNLLGLQLVRALAGRDAEGLLLVGDGRQAVYPGGARLRDAGIDVTGRAAVLRVNYRNTVEILAGADSLVPSVRSGDPDDPGESDAVTAVRHGPRPVEVTADRPGLEAALLSALAEAAQRRSGHVGSAVLCRHRWEVHRYRDLLVRAGLPVQSLEDYDGSGIDGIVVGTYKRAKGLDLPAVFLPEVRRPAVQLGPVAAERAEFDDRELHVAATRARDELWIGYLGERRR
jgi:AAA domain/Nuclease-related domain